MRITPILSKESIPASPDYRAPANAFTGIARGFSILGEGLEHSAWQWDRVAQMQIAVDKKKNFLADQGEAAKRIADLELKSDNLLSSLKHENVKRMDVMDEFKKGWQKISIDFQDQIKSIKSPEISSHLDQALTKQEAILTIKARRIDDDKWVKDVTATIYDLKKNLEKNLPGMTPEEQQKELEGYKNFVAQHVDAGVISPKDAITLENDLKENAEVHTWMVKSRMDPLGTYTELLETDLSHLPVEKQNRVIGFLEARVKAVDTMRRQLESDAKKAYDDNKRQIMNVLQGQIDRGEDINEPTAYLRDQGFLDHEDVKKMRAEQESRLKAVEKENDPATVDWAINGLYGSKITISEGELRAKRNAGLLNQKTYQQYMEHRTSRIESLRKEGESKEQVLKNRRYAQAEQIFSEAMRTEGPAAAVIDRGAKQLYAQGLTELFNLDRDGKNPMEEVWGLVDRYGQALETHKWVESRKIRGTLLVPNKLNSTIYEMYDWLEMNKGTMPKATYLQQKNLLRTIESLEARQEAEKALKPPKAKEKK